MKSASIVPRQRRRMTLFAFGLGMFTLLTAIMSADLRPTRAAGIGHGASYALSSAQKSDALYLVVAPGFDRKAVAAASLSPDPGVAAGAGGPGKLENSLALAAVLSALAAFNFGFLRHLRRVYASPRRGASRKG